MATVVIKNFNDLTKILKSRMEQALKMTQDEIYTEFEKSWQAYYDEPVFNGSNVPKVYERTYTLLHALIKTDIVQTGNGLSCTVEVNSSYLDQTYKGGATGREVMEWANAKSHGGAVDGELEIWNDVVDYFGGENGIRDLMKINLQKCSVPIK